MVLLSDSAPIGLLPRRLAWDVLQAVAAGAYADVAADCREDYEALLQHAL